MKKNCTPILYVANMRVPSEKAHGYQIFKTCEAFLRQGRDVELAVPFRFNDKKLKNYSPSQYYHLQENIRFRTLPAIDLMPFSRFIPWKISFFETVFSIINSLTFSFSLIVFLFFRNDIDSIYTRDVNIFSIIKPIVSFFRSKMIYLIEIHSIPFVPWRFKRFVRIINNADLIISINEQMKNKILKENQWFSVPIIVLHDGVDLTLFDQKLEKKSMRKELNLPLDKKILAFIGKFHTNNLEKGIEEIIKSSVFLFQKRTDLLFLFVGGPENYIKKYKKLINDLSLDENDYIFKDKRPVEEVPQYLCASDILLMPHPDHLFFKTCISPLKLFEYMAASRPIIASAIPPVLEILTHDYNSYLVTPGSPQEIALGVQELLANVEKGDQLAKQAYQDVQEMTWDERTKKIISSLNSL